MATQNFNLILTDLCVSVSNFTLPQDQTFIDYKNEYVLVDTTGEYSNLAPSRLIKQISTLTKTLLDTHTEDEVLSFLTILFDKVNTLIVPINVDFFAKYLISKVKFDDQLMPTVDKIVALEAANADGKAINNILYELEYSNALLSDYLEDIPNSLDKAKAISDKIKLLIPEKGTLPIAIISF